jgi:hypothetical protein
MPREFTSRERVLILALGRSREEWSLNDIARLLNDVLPEDNNRCRTGNGVRQWLVKETGKSLSQKVIDLRRKQ